MNTDICHAERQKRVVCATEDWHVIDYELLPGFLIAIDQLLAY
jgi:hypothetical protein